MSGLMNSNLNGSANNLPDSTGRAFASSFTGQSGSVPGYHQLGLHTFQGNFSLPNMQGSLTPRNTVMSGLPSSGVPQPGGSISSGRFTSNNIPVAMSQIPHGHSGVSSRGGMSVGGNPAFSSGMNAVGGSVPGLSSNMGLVGNRNSVPGMSVSPVLGNLTPRITSSVGTIPGGNTIGRNISSSGLSVPSIASRINLAGNNGGGNLNLQGSSRLIGGMLQQGPLMSIIGGNSYSASGGLSQNQVQGGNNSLGTVGMLHDMNSNDSAPFDINDFPQLTGRPNSAGGPQGQYGSLRKQGVGVSSIVQPNQEFSIQNEDFPALPGYKGATADYSIDVQKEQLHENVPIMPAQHYPISRSSGFNISHNFPNSRQLQQSANSVSNSGISFAAASNQDLLHLHNSDLFPSSQGSYHSMVQNSGLQNIGLRPPNSSTQASSLGAYEQLAQQYQQAQNQSTFRLQQMPSATQSYRDQSLKSAQGTQAPDPYNLLGLLSVIRMQNPELASLSLGIDLTTLGLNLNSVDDLYKTFGSPWMNEPAKGDPDYVIPSCYCAEQPPILQPVHFTKFQTVTLFYIFYSMPKDEAQLYAASELYNRGWFYHREQRFWLTRVPNMESLVKTPTHERGSYFCFDPTTWETIRKDNFVLQYDAVEKRPNPSPAQNVR